MEDKNWVQEIKKQFKVITKITHFEIMPSAPCLM